MVYIINYPTAILRSLACSNALGRAASLVLVANILAYKGTRPGETVYAYFGLPASLFVFVDAVEDSLQATSVNF